MNTKTRRLGLLGGVAAVAALGLGGWALALDRFDPTDTWNVTPIAKSFPGDRACESGTLVEDIFISVTEGDPTSATETVLIDGVSVTIDVTTYADNSFDFAITNGVTPQMFVKGGQDGGYLLYQYVPEVDGATNTGPVSYDTGLHDGYVDGNDNYQDVSHLDFCIQPVVPLEAEKTASASYDERHDWGVTKTVTDPADQFAGETVGPWTWTIDVSETVVDQNFAVSGEITVHNDNAFAVPVTISDVLNDGTAATVTCPSTEDATGTVPANASLTCAYQANPGDTSATLNTATIVSGNPAVEGDIATAPVSFVKSVVNGSATVSDTEIGLSSVSVAGDDQFTADDSDVCSSNPSDYGENGMYTVDLSNTATLVDEEGTEYTSTATTSYDCYAPIVAKDASASYDERHDWDVTKTVTDPADQFAGEDVGPWTWTIDIEETVVDQNFAVSGTIYVENPAGSPGPITVALADVLDDGTPVTLDCGGSLEVASGATATCGYSAAPDDASATLNTATGTFNAIDFVATAPVSFVKSVVNGSATVSDTEIGLVDESVAGGDQFTADDSDVCSSNPADYGENGMYTVDLSNTATLVDEEGTEYTSTATTSYDCYAPIVTKDAAASYDERHDWNVTKTVTDPIGPFYPGDEPSWTWTIDIEETVVDQNFAVSGNIDVTNPAGSPGSITVALADVLDDGTPVTLDCDGSLTVAPGTTETCGYSAAPDDASATLNTATGTFNEIDFVATADVSFEKTVVNDEATFSDPYLKIEHTVVYDSSSADYPETAVCSKNWADYGADGMYTVDLSNTAILVDEEGTEYTSTAATSYTCEAGKAQVLKTTDDALNSAKDWQFALYLGPDGFGGTQVGETSSTLGDTDGILEFGQPALRPDTTYTICELGVPAAWTSYWQVDVDGDGVIDASLIPYNPNADDDPPEDLGNRCVDFGAETTIPVAVGTTIEFVVDNAYPGGDPRTPGYWKNWNRCTNGGQQYTADANGGWEEGFWLLEDVLDPYIGGGIVWDDILFDEFRYPIDQCAVAVDILDKRLVGDPGVVGDDKKVASDPLHNLATALLAAELNQGAGACNTPEVLEAIMDAEELLDKYNFDGDGHDNLSKKSSDVGLANGLAEYLDLYNNGEFCGSTTE